MTVTRAQYLCELAMTAHVPPPVVDGLAVTDFAILVAGLDARRAAIERQAG